MKKKKKLLFVFGTRPEAIKMAPVIIEFLKEKDLFDIVVCSTGQHKEMLNQVINFFNIKLNYELKLMTKNQSLNDLSAKILSSLKKVLDKENPDYVFVHGDTTTTAFASIASFYNKIKICHIEAGLRTFNKYSPFPEEINRMITGRLADLHFAPTEKAAKNLISENVNKNSIFITGNTVIDALLIGIKITKNYKDPQIDQLKNVISKNNKIVLVTGHRRENFGKGFENICSAILELSKDKNIDIIYPVHLNPNVKDIVYKMLSGSSNIHLIDPLNYPAFIWLMNRSYLILTDSGGVQEEAPTLGIPTLVMRNTTERPEGIKQGTAILVGTEKKKIISTTKKLLENKEFYKKFSQNINPYGDGKAAKRIVTFLKKNG
jgi:UDP-N-acetylglucosamine 2-epimerase (non-hydrolysing)